MIGSIASALLCVLLACAGSAAAAQGAPLLIGAVVSQSGPHADLGTEYGRGLELWRDEVNAAGGVLGRRIELRVLDDASDASRTGALYAQMLRDGAAALIGPYGTAATLVAAAEAERAQRVLVNGAGWSRAVHKRAPHFVFQSAVPYNAYGPAIMALVHRAGLKRALILVRDDPVAAEMAASAVEAAERLGIATGAPLTYAGGTVDFVPIAARARSEDAQAWIAFGEVRDAAEMVKGLKKLGYAPKLFFVRGAADEQLISLVGQDAEFAMGAHAWQADAARRGNDAFVRAFRARWSREPAPPAAQGYAAGAVLAEGLRRAGTAETRALRAALASLQTTTLLGPYRVDPNTGAQVGATPLIVQILGGERRIVAPPGEAQASPVLPYPLWSERRVLK